MTQQEIIDARIAEVAQYQQNINLYTAIAAALPSEWPDHLLLYKNSTDRHNDIASLQDLNDVALVGDLWAYDDAQKAIRAETIEMRKSQAILAALQAQP